MATMTTGEWVKKRIRPEEITKYLNKGKDFIDEELIERVLAEAQEPAPELIDEILEKSLAIQTLSPAEAAALLHVNDPATLEKMRATAREVKKRVYDNRIVTFAPLYLGDYCVNSCEYCAFRKENGEMDRHVLSSEEIKREIEVLAGKIGHKRVIAVYGEHPKTGIDYMVDSLKTMYSVKIPTRRGGEAGIRRINVNAAPLTVAELKQLKEAGIGTFQVFQETYHHETYSKVHPAGTLKGDYRWRLYAMHRAMEAGVDDVGLGALFGLYNWRFEVMGLVLHNIELENRYNIGAHTISFPRLEPAAHTDMNRFERYRVADDEMKKLVTVIRLAIPHAGMILTARENAEMRRAIIPMGCTQTDASTRIGIGGYADTTEGQVTEKQQFELGDTRSLDEVVRELAELGHITSFCTAGYRCGRTGDKIMGLLRSGTEGKFCKLNAILTYREWLDDFASDETKAIGEKLILKELAEVKETNPDAYPHLQEFYAKIVAGKRDLYF